MNELLQKLSVRKSTDCVFNPYYEQPSVLNNLKFFLEWLQANNNGYLLVGEAPGYKGCRISGIPFTSTYVINYSLHPLWSEYRQHFDIEKPQKEASATLVWKHLERMDSLPIIWNAFPFHPHQLGIPNSNRTPTKVEIEEGKPYIDLILELCNKPKLIAVGNKAYDQLKLMGYDVEKIRHPANGGSSEFEQGISKVMLTGTNTK
jgi:uracil-DNA glycosylase